MLTRLQLMVGGAILSLAMLGGAFAFGFHRGTVSEIRKQEEARLELQEDLFDLADELSLRNAEILRLQREREGLINDLEEQALDANGADNPGVVSTGGLLRLEQRWGSGTGTPD